MIHYLVGDNRYEIGHYVKKITDDFVKKYGDLAIERFDADEIESPIIINALGSLPFLSPAKLVVVKSANSKDLIEQILEHDIPNEIEAIIVIDKADKRLGYYKKISKLPGFKLFDQAKSNVSARWIVDYVSSGQGNISQSDASYLLGRVGTNQSLISNELDKLLAYNSKITKDSINLLTEPTPLSTTFDLLESAFSGNFDKVEQIYKQQRLQKVEPLKILGLVAWQLNILALVKLASRRSVDEIAKDAKIHPFVAKKTINLANNLKLKQVKKMVDDACELDLSIKTKNIDADRAVLLYLLSLRG